jgi:hypothetical protein
MSSSTKREVSHDPRKTEPRQRRSSRLNRKYTGSYSRRSSISRETKMPKIVRSSSSTEMPKLETLYSPNKGSPTVIKVHEDNDNSKSKLSSKMSFWGSPDLSPGIESLFKEMNLCDSSRSLIISINLCIFKNMIQLSNLGLDDISTLFSCKDLRDSSFQDTIIKVLCLGKCFQISIREKFGLKEDVGIAEQQIPTTFNEETDFLGEDNMSSLKRHYMSCYWKVHKDFLDYVEDSMSCDFLIGSTISTRLQKNISCASRLSSPSVLSNDTKTSKVSKKADPLDFYPKHLNHAFIPKPDFEG